MAWRRPTSVHEWLGILLRHKKKFLFPALIVMIVVTWCSRYMEREYRAEAKIRRQADAAAQEMNNPTVKRSLDMIRQQMREDVMGRAAIEELIQSLKLNRGWTIVGTGPDATLSAQSEFEKQQLIDDLQSRIRVYEQGRGGTIDQVVVEVIHPDQRLAPKIANQLVDNYINRTRLRLDDQLAQAKNFFDKQVRDFATKVSDKRVEKLKFEMENESLLPEGPSSVTARLTTLESKHASLQSEVDMLRQEKIALEALVERQPEWLDIPISATNPALEPLINRRNILMEELDAHRRMGRKPAHPAVQKTREALLAVEREMEDVEQVVEIGSQKSINAKREQAFLDIARINGRLAALESERSAVGKELEAYRIKAGNYFTIRDQYERILRDLDDLDSELGFWKDKLNQTSLALTAEINARGVRTELLQAAPKLGTLANPSWIKILGMALVLGVGTGVCLVLLAELTDRSIRSVEHAVDDIKLPVLGAVDEIVSRGRLARERVLNWMLYPTAGAAMVLVLGMAMVMTYYSLSEPHVYEGVGPVEFVSRFLETRGI